MAENIGPLTRPGSSMYTTGPSISKKKGIRESIRRKLVNEIAADKIAIKSQGFGRGYHRRLAKARISLFITYIPLVRKILGVIARHNKKSNV